MAKSISPYISTFRILHEAPAHFFFSTFDPIGRQQLINISDVEEPRGKRKLHYPLMILITHNLI